MSLVEPDAVHQAFDRAIQIGVLEDDEGRFATQLEGQPFVAGRSRAANSASDFRRAGESYLGDVGMLHESFAGGTVASNNIDYSRRQPDFLADFGERERSQRSELCRL